MPLIAEHLLLPILVILPLAGALAIPIVASFVHNVGGRSADNLTRAWALLVSLAPA